MPQYCIELYRKNGSWWAHTNDQEIRQAFGNGDVPTAYGDSMPSKAVLRAIQELNPTSTVKLRDGVLE